MGADQLGWLREDGPSEATGPAYEPGPGSTDILPPRTAAQVADWTVVLLPVVVVHFALTARGVPLLARLLVDGAFLFVYGAVLEGYWDGRTVGKAVMGIKVVGADGAEITPRQALVRNLPAVVAPLWLPYVVALLSIVGTDLNQRAFDRVADTAVVRI